MLADHLRKLRGARADENPLRDPTRAGRSDADDLVSTALRVRLSAPEESRIGTEYVHASRLFDLCTRQHALGAELRGLDQTVQEVFGAPLRWRFDVGNAVHDLLRDHLARAQLIEGRWVCQGCGARHPSDDPSETCLLPWDGDGEYCPRCAGTSLAFIEPAYRNHEYKVVGHVDCIFVTPRGGRECGELKSVESAVFRLKAGRMKLPHAEHVFRAHVYCWLTGLPRCRLVYASTGIERGTPFKEFVVRFDVRVLDKALKKLAELRTGGERSCASRDDKKALLCPVAKLCWSR